MDWLHVVPIAHALSSVSSAVEDGVFVLVFLLSLVKNVEESRFRLSHNIYSIHHTDSVVSFESFRALKLSKSESFRDLIFSQHFLNFRALKLSNFAIFRALKISKYESYRVLRVTLFEIIRALKISINSITRFIFKL